jgi:uncharacterized protein YcbX
VRVLELWRYPVKSLQGERIESVDLGRVGLTGDRAWGLTDVQTGLVLTARREPNLLFGSARIGRDGVEVYDEAGRLLRTDRDISNWLERPVELRRAHPSAGGTFEAPVDDFHEDGQWKQWEGHAGSFHDSQRTTVSLASVLSIGEWDPRRFRANVILDDDGAPSPTTENAWVGKELTAGTARLDVRRRIDRCVVVTRAQPGLGRNLDVLKSIHAESDGCVGIGAWVTSPGRLAVGDDVRTV